jgi:hypothetical protein
MKLFKAFRSDRRSEAQDPDAPVLSDADATLTSDYERLGERDAVAGLTGRNQEELAAIETFERSHRGREAVLNKLRYLQQPEPLPNYDALDPEAIVEILATADSNTVKAVREYERKLLNRPTVMAAVASAVRVQRAEVAPADGLPPALTPFVEGNGHPPRTKPDPAP